MKNINKKRITCLLGAGAAIEIGGPTTDDITSKIMEKNKFINNIALELERYYGEDRFHFEDIFHAIETLSSFCCHQNARKEYKPILGAFIERFNRKYLNSLELIRAEHEFLMELLEMINEYDKQLMKDKNHWYRDFWNSMENNFLLDIATLNYDTTVQKSLKLEWNDGFQKVENSNYYRFNVNKIKELNQSRIMNLHGAINFGYYQDADPNRFVLEDDFNELYKYESYSEARKSWNIIRSSNYSQDGTITQVTPIITGLRKTDKLLTYPMSIYSTIFTTSILENPNLLICGYSFGDKHINKIIEKMNSIHGENRRIVIITYINKYDKDNWHPAVQQMEWINNEIITFISKSFNEFYPLNNYKYKNPLKSKDGKAMIYFEGFKNTVQNYKTDIIEFFNESIKV